MSLRLGNLGTKRPALLASGLVAVMLASPAGAQLGFVVDKLVADQPGVAKFTDPNLVNPWGIALNATGPWWVSNNGTGTSTLYRGDGTIVPLVVAIPGPGGTPSGKPSGIVFNGTSGFGVTGGAARFIFGTEDGTVAGWRTGTSAQLTVDNSGLGAVYKGLGIGSAGGSSFLYAANFTSGTVDIFDQNYGAVSPGSGPISGSAFLDPTLPAGYSPFNVQVLNGRVFVTYAMTQQGSTDELAGPGLGIVDEYATDGSLVRRIGTGGALDAPWGLALAPSDFAEYAGALLVGNFGDGRINAFDPNTGTFLGQLMDGTGASPLSIDGLWGIGFGNGALGGKASDLYFAAGTDDEAHGLFGRLQAVPEPGAAAMLGACAAVGAGGLARRRRRTA